MKRLVLLLLVLLPGVACASRVVRTAYCTDPGQCERRQDGSFRGLLIDYLVEIARVNDWRIEPVYCSYGEALERLARGEIDLVGGVSALPERREKFRFATYPSGFLRPHLFVRPDSPCIPGRVETWRGLEIAVGPGVQARRLLADYLSANGLDCRLQVYSNATDAVTAFVRGKAAAIYSPGPAALVSAKVLKTFPAIPGYFCTPNGNPDLGRELDEALRRILAAKPDFADELSARYFPVSPRLEVNYTEEERRWLRHRIRLRLPVVIDLSPECRPFKWRDAKTGEPAGFAKHLLDEVSRRTGLTFSYLPQTSEAFARMRYLKGESDLWVSYGAAAEDLPGLADGIPVHDFEIVLASLSDRPAGNLSQIVLGVPTWEDGLATACVRAGVRNLVRFDTSHQVMKALLAGRIDAIATTTSVALLLRRKYRVEDRLDIQPLSSRIAYRTRFSLVPSNTSDPCLSGVLRKCLSSFTEEELLAMSYRSFTDAVEKPILTDHAWLMLVITILLVALVTVVVIFTTYSRRISSALALARAGEQSRTQFLATVSHEIRTPLNAVVGFAESLGSPQLGRAEVESYADGILKASHVLLDLINDVLDLSKLEAGKVDMRSGVLDLRRLSDDLQRIFSSKAAEKSLRLEFRLPDEISGLQLSPRSFRQVLLNLIGNSVKFTNEGGVVTTFATEPSGPRTVNLTMSVSDTGIGISAESLPTIFDPFIQDIATRGGHVYDGTGLGLPIVKRIVEAAAGTIEVASEVGHGTTFTIRIPDVACTELPAETPRPSGESKAVSLPKTVLIVDDVPMNLRILRIHLNRVGVSDVLEASSGEEALSVLKDRPVDAVLTDVWMPGMNGAELARKIRGQEAFRSLRIIAVTADAASGNTFDMTPFTDILVKPMTREKVLAAFGGPHAFET